MLNHEINDALDGVAANRDELRIALMKRTPYEVGDSEDPTTLDFTGADVLAVSFMNVHFTYDPTDTTSVHDGTTVIATADGKRFKADGYRGQPSRTYVIQDKDLTAPPGSPTLGEHWIVAAGATGDWATHVDEIASWTARGWVFIAPLAYDRAYIVDEARDYHITAGGVWTQGQPGIIIAANSVGLSELELGLGLAVENQTTNTPPGSPTAGASYIIGPSPTGAWAGDAGKLTRYENSAWVTRTPQNGWMVRDKSQLSVFVYNGATWDAVSAGILAANTALDLDLETITTVGSGAYTYSRSTAPTSALEHVLETLTIDHSAAASGRKLIVEYDCVGQPNSNQGTMVFALHRDAETSPLAYTAGSNVQSLQPYRARFIFDSDDSASHTYKIRIYMAVTNPTSWDLSARNLTIMELAV